jgi:hypothetical protein
MSAAPVGASGHDPNVHRPATTRNNPTPLDVIFILFASVALVFFILSFSVVQGAEFFQNAQWLIHAVSNVWSRLSIGAGTLASLGLRRWLDRSPAPNYFVWIPVFTGSMLVAILFTISRTIPPPPAVLKATIDEPKAGQTVTRRTFICKGTARGVGPQTHLWLAIEANNHIWPKESEVRVSDGTWENTVYEDGATDRFSISLFSANDAAERQITQWIEAGKRTGQYTELVGIPGTVRLARIDNLKLKAN